MKILLFLFLVNWNFLIQTLVVSATFETVPPNCTLTGNSLANLTSITSNCQEILIRNFEVPSGKNIQLNVQDGATVFFADKVTFGYGEWEGYLITIRGNNLKIIGVPGNLFDCNGSRWWDGLGGNGGKAKPKFLRLTGVTNSIVNGLNIKNTPKHCLAIKSCKNVTISNVTIDDREGDFNGGHNTDAFGISESDEITITNCVVYNQDDCLALTSGTNTVFKHNYCSGGHGISIGSIGNHRVNEVDNFYVKNCTVVNSANGIRIKTNFNTTGVIKNVTYEDVTVGNITNYGVVIRGDYLNGGATGTPTPGFKISNITLRNVHGTVQPTAGNVLIILSEGVASNWTFEDVNIVGGLKKVNCTGIPEDSGFSCNNPSVLTI
ncbi:polygalacturonase-like [Agrilus planipennis]|uniref:endo-polygalacturonase n=1 Tax=Agrilus planipennis TaxID=224129 RepID=A0A1W4WKN1_AGRPL|nr:polygalacturonase-like [Agrilus planipennis]